MSFDVADWTRYLDCREEFERNTGVLSDFIHAGTGGDPAMMNADQLAASKAFSAMTTEFYELKDMFYSALGSEKVFVPDLAGEYGDLLDWEEEEEF